LSTKKLAVTFSALLGWKFELVFTLVVGQPLLSQDSAERSEDGAGEAGEEEVVDANGVREGSEGTVV